MGYLSVVSHVNGLIQISEQLELNCYIIKMVPAMEGDRPKCSPRENIVDRGLWAEVNNVFEGWTFWSIARHERAPFFISYRKPCGNYYAYVAPPYAESRTMHGFNACICWSWRDVTWRDATRRVHTKCTRQYARQKMRVRYFRPTFNLVSQHAY